MARLLVRLLEDQRGATIIEYGFTAALIAIVLVAALTTLGTNIGKVLNNVAGNI
jgi:pilus assembly protein Flp/PilA